MLVLMRLIRSAAPVLVVALAFAAALAAGGVAFANDYGQPTPWQMGFQKSAAPTMDDICMRTYIMYMQKIPARSRSGKQLTQGQQLGFIWKAKAPGGHSIIDGERYDWGEWDIVLIPIRTKGCVVQHFNDSDEDIEIMFCSLNQVYSAGVDRGSGFDQLEDCPEYRQQMAAVRAAANR